MSDFIGANFIDLNCKYNKNIPRNQQWSYKWKQSDNNKRSQIIKDFVKYIGRIDGTAIDENCLSHSLFGRFINSNSAIEQLSMNEIRHYTGQIASKGIEMFNSVISLKEDEAVRVGFTDRETWKNMINKKMKDIGEEYGIESSNLEYVASIHSEEGHIHCHLVFWKENETEDGRIEKKKDWNKIRKDLNKEIFNKELEENYELQNKSKKEIGTETEKFLDSELKNSIKELSPILFERYFNNKINSDSLKILSNIIKNISEKQKRLSKENNNKIRYVYKYQPPEIKKLLLEAAKEIIRSNTECNKEFNSYVSATIEIQKILGNIGFKNPIEKAKAKAEETMLIKIANNVLDFIKQEKIDESNFKKREYEERQEEYEKKKKYFIIIRKEKQAEYEKNVSYNALRRLTNKSYRTCQQNNISQQATLKRMINYSNLTKSAKKELALKNKFKSSIDWER